MLQVVSRFRPRARVGLAAVAGGVVLLLAVSAPPVSARVTLPHDTIYQYNVKVGVKGGFTLTDNNSGPDNGDMAQESGGGGGRCVKPTEANRHARKCQRRVTLSGSFTRAGSAGANGFRFTRPHGALSHNPPAHD
jgi:hypothetical protein